MPVKYSGVLKFTDEIKAEIDLAADGTVEKAVLIDGDGTETPIGGGTSSDYTTATVSITNSLVTGPVQFAVARTALSHGGSGSIDPVTTVEATATRTVTVVLYKGSSACKVITPLGQNVEATATGNITGSSPNFQIRGDGAITVAATE